MTSPTTQTGPADNILQNVQTYNDSGLAVLLNQMPVVSQTNMKFKNFQDITGQLGQTVTFDKPSRFASNDGLVITDFGDIEQRVQSLTVDQARNVNYAYNAQQFIFNVEEYEPKLNMDSIGELAAFIESSFSSVMNGYSYRYYVNSTPGPLAGITTYQDLATAIAQMKVFGVPKGKIKAFIPPLMVPQIIGSGLTQFVPNRNEDIANSWELGSFAGVDYYQADYLPIHYSGPCQYGVTPLNDLSISAIDSTGTLLTLHSATQTSITDFIVEGDNATISDTSLINPLTFLTFTGHQRSPLKVQFNVKVGGDLDVDGNVTVTVDPPLLYANIITRNINLSKALATDASMKVNFLPTHHCAMLVAGDALFGAMPRLPDEDPYKTVVSTDAETGVSLRTYVGSVFAKNTRAMVHDAIWGNTAVPEYLFKLPIPVAQ